MLSVVGQMVNLLTEQNVAKSLSLLGPGDIYMRPELGNITAADFKRQIEAADIGRKAALAVADKLRALSVSPEEYQAWRARVRLEPGAEAAGGRRGARRRRRGSSTRGDCARRAPEGGRAPRLRRSWRRTSSLVYSRGDLQSLDYSVLRERDKTILKLTPIEKSWGPDYLRFGMNLVLGLPHGLALQRARALPEDVDQRLWRGMAHCAADGQQPGVRRRSSTSRSTSGSGSSCGRPSSTAAREGSGSTSTATGWPSTGCGKTAPGWTGREPRRLRTGQRGLARAAPEHHALEIGDPCSRTRRVKSAASRRPLALDTQDFAFFPTKGYKANRRLLRGGTRQSTGVEKYGHVEGRLSSAWSLGDLILLGGIEGGQATRRTASLRTRPSRWAVSGRLSAYAPGADRRPGGLRPGQRAGAVPADEADADPRVLAPRGRDRTRRVT